VEEFTPFFLALTAIAAAVSSVVSYRSWRDSRDEREARSRTEHFHRLQLAHDELGEALLELAKHAADAGIPGRGFAYSLARVRAHHLLNLALHPDIEEGYGAVVDLIDAPPEEVTPERVERVLYAVFNSRESVGDSHARAVRGWA
jgi:hypothetical protein